MSPYTSTTNHSEIGVLNAPAAALRDRSLLFGTSLVSGDLWPWSNGDAMNISKRSPTPKIHKKNPEKNDEMVLEDFLTSIPFSDMSHFCSHTLSF